MSKTFSIVQIWKIMISVFLLLFVLICAIGGIYFWRALASSGSVEQPESISATSTQQRIDRATLDRAVKIIEAREAAWAKLQKTKPTLPDPSR